MIIQIWILYMDFMYGFCDGNSRWTDEEYHLRYPHRQAHKRAEFVALHQKVKDTDSFHNVCKSDHIQFSANVETYVLEWKKIQVWIHRYLWKKVEFQILKD